MKSLTSLIAFMMANLPRINSYLFGSKSQKGGTTGKARNQRSRKQYMDDLDGIPGF